MSKVSTDDLSAAIASIPNLSHNIFIHSNIHLLGLSRKTLNESNVLGILQKSSRKQNVTLIVPTYTYSFGQSSLSRVFSSDTPAPLMGTFSEYVRTHPQSKRSQDPMFSVSALGPRASSFVDMISTNSFDNGSVMARLYDDDTSILCINHIGATILHYFERMLNVQYRFDKVVEGHIETEHSRALTSWTTYVRDTDDFSTVHNPRFFHRYLVDNRVLHQAYIGRGIVTHIRAQTLYKHLRMFLTENPGGLCA